jgi:hypothetical protein
MVWTKSIAPVGSDQNNIHEQIDISSTSSEKVMQ